MVPKKQTCLFLEGAIYFARAAGANAQEAFEIVCVLNGVTPSHAPIQFKFAVQRIYDLR